MKIRSPALERGSNAERTEVDALLQASPDTVVWGAITPDKPPVLRIEPGSTVRIETISQQPLNYQDPVSFFGAA